MRLLAEPFSFLLCGWEHRQLILRLTRRRIAERYRGSLLGGAWVVGLPVLMLGIYTFVFSVVMKQHWGGAPGETHFSLLLFCGLIVFSVFGDCATEAPGLIHANQNFIKQVLFPSEILAWVSLLGSLWRFAVSLALLLVFEVWSMGWPPEPLWLPAALVPVSLLTLGTTWLFASLGVFLRDLSQVVSVITTALLFLSPVFYPASRAPSEFAGWFRWNPFSTILETARAALFTGRPPDWQLVAILTGASWLFAWAAYTWFMRTKSSFADVL